MQRFDKLAWCWYQPYLFGFRDAEKNAAFVEKFGEIEAFIKDNMGSAAYLSGTDQPMYIDIYCFPLIERMILLEHSFPEFWNEQDMRATLALAYDYVHRMMEHPSFRNYHASPEAWVEHCKLQKARNDGVKVQLSISYFNREKYN